MTKAELNGIIKDYSLSKRYCYTGIPSDYYINIYMNNFEETITIKNSTWGKIIPLSDNSSHITITLKFYGVNN